MICTKCNNDGVESQALGKTFYYCRTCKEEIQLEVKARHSKIEGLQSLVALEMQQELEKYAYTYYPVLWGQYLMRSGLNA